MNRTLNNPMLFFSLASSSRCDSEVQKILFQSLYGRPNNLVAVEDIAHFFSQPKQFPQSITCPPLWIFNGQIKQLEHSLEGFLEAIMISSLEGPCGALELASDVAELFVYREGEPAAVFESFVDERFHLMSEFTISIISCRVLASSTPRERLPIRGLMLIIESNSIHSNLGFS